jgi:phosphatidylglycerophosphate synthase
VCYRNDMRASRQRLTIPNILTIGRALAIPWLFILMRNDPGRNWWIAGLFALTDNLDGVLARAGDHHPQLRALGLRRSIAGQKWDPVVDKAFVASILVAGMLHGAIPVWLGALSLAQKAVAAGVAFVARLRHIELEVNKAGKYGEFISIVGFGLFFIAETDRLQSVRPAIRGAATVLALTGIAMAVRATILYGKKIGPAAPENIR